MATIDEVFGLEEADAVLRDRPVAQDTVPNQDSLNLEQALFRGPRQFKRTRRADPRSEMAKLDSILGAKADSVLEDLDRVMRHSPLGVIGRIVGGLKGGVEELIDRLRRARRGMP